MFFLPLPCPAFPQGCIHSPAAIPPSPAPPIQPECCCWVPPAATDASATRQSPAGQEGGARLSCTCIAARGLSWAAMPLLRQTSRDSVALPPRFSPPSAHLCCFPRATTAARDDRVDLSLPVIVPVPPGRQAFTQVTQGVGSGNTPSGGRVGYGSSIGPTGLPQWSPARDTADDRHQPTPHGVSCFPVVQDCSTL